MQALDIVLLVTLVFGNLMALAIWWHLFGGPLRWAWRFFFRPTENAISRTPSFEPSGRDRNRVCHQFS